MVWSGSRMDPSLTSVRRMVEANCSSVVRAARKTNSTKIPAALQRLVFVRNVQKEPTGSDMKYPFRCLV